MKRFSVVVMAAVMSVSFIACGHRGGDMDTDHMHQFIAQKIDRMLEKIDATDEQRVKIAAIREGFAGEMQKMKAVQPEGFQFVLDEIKSDAPDREKLHRMLDERIEAHKAFAHKAIDAALDVHAVLTPQQRTLVLETMEKFHQKHRGRFMQFHQRFGDCEKNR
jgi:protein CpxP